jgi:predicted nucleotidyltransferase
MMVDRLALAKQYVQEMLEKRDDVVGAFVVGSVARGDATATSDIDLALVVEKEGVGTAWVERVDTWREGVYIDAHLVNAEKYSDAQKILLDPIAADYIYGCRILYDPLGHYSRMRREVRAVYLTPECLQARVKHQVEMLRECVSALSEAVAASDILDTCWQEIWISLWLSCVPFVIKGEAPSSTKALTNLDSIAPELKRRMLEWEGSAGLSADQVAALLPPVQVALAWMLEADPAQSVFGEYLARTAEAMAASGRHREAVQLLWRVFGGLCLVARAVDDPQSVSEATSMMEDWFPAVGWEGQEVLEEKVRMAEEMVAEVEAMAAHLLTGDK